MRKILGILLFAFFSFFLAHAEESKIKGIVVDAEGLPLPSASILLFSGNPAKQVKGVVSDDEGNFLLDKLKYGDYRLEISYIGFRKKVINLSLTAEKPNIRYGKLRLAEDASLLTAVEVSAKCSSLQIDIDKKTFLVNENAVADGMSASEVLKEIPSVGVDIEGNVSLRNSENVEIYINGKPAGLTDENRGEILEQLPAGSVEKVEVITNPSSKFDAEGSAGIINIVMKTDHKEASYYGSVSGGISYPWDGKLGGNLGANINYAKGKWSTFASIGYLNRKSVGGGYTDRVTYGADTTYLNQDQKSDFEMNSGFLRLGSDYKINDKNSIGISGIFSLGSRDRNQYMDYHRGIRLLGEDNLLSIQKRNSLSQNDRKMGNAIIDYNHKFAEGHSLSASFNFFANSNENDCLYDQSDYDSDGIFLDNTNSLQHQTNENRSRNVEIQSDYVNPLTEKSKLEAGVKASFQNQESDVLSEIKEGDVDSYSLQPELANDFELQQNVYAAYVSFGQKIKKFSMQLGLRGELTSVTWDQHTINEESEQDPYFGVFPTTFFSYSFNENNELQLSYTRRISRPRRRWLNPYINVSDSANISFGNPDLNPEYTNSFEFSYIKTFSPCHMFMSSVYYQLTQDVIQSYSWLKEETMMTTRANMTSSHSSGFEFVLKDKFKYLNLTTSLNLYYYKLMGGDFVVDVVLPDVETEKQSISINDRESFSWTAQLSADFPLPKSFTVQLTGNYRSPKATAQGKTLNDYFVNLGVKKSFLSRKLTASLSVRDLLNSRKRRSETWSDNFYQESESTWSGRTINLNLTYNFGNLGSKQKQKNSSEKNMEEDEMFDF